jgi:hypothetical protein
LQPLSLGKFSFKFLTSVITRIDFSPKERNFCSGRPLSSLAPGAKKSSYATGDEPLYNKQWRDF